MFFVSQVFGFRHVEIDPHFAVVGERGQQIALVDQAAQPALEMVHDATERRLDGGEVQVRLGQGNLGFGLVQFGLRQRQLILRYDVIVGQLFGVLVFEAHETGFCLRFFQLCLVYQRHNLEHRLPLFHYLSLIDKDFLQIAFFQGS